MPERLRSYLVVVAAVAVTVLLAMFAAACSMVADGWLALGPVVALAAAAYVLGSAIEMRNTRVLLDRERDTLDLIHEAVRQRDAARADLDRATTQPRSGS